MSKRRKYDGPGIDKLVEKQMRHWELARSQRLTLPVDQRSEVADFIAISREIGAGAAEAASLIAARLNWPKIDREILQAMTGDDATRHKIYESMDERDLKWWEEFCRSILEPDFVRNDYFGRLVKTTLSLARQSSAVFLGRGIDIMLPRDLGFRVRLVAPFDTRVKRIAVRKGMSTEEARRDVQRIDRERAEFIENHFHVRDDDTARFDLTLSTEHLTPVQIADVILLVRDVMKGRSTK